MNDKKILLPHNSDGIANLEIRRMQSELEKKPKPIEMIGHMPVPVANTAIRAMRKTIEDIERGKVSSCCLLVIKPNKNGLDTAECSMNVKQDEFGKIDELFHVALMQVPPDPGEAG